MPRMPDDMAARYGEIFDEFEASIEVLNRSKADTIADLRADLKELGMTGAEISAEVAMLKGAVKLQRMTEAEREKAEAKDDGVADYATVLALARTRARTRGAEHDADGVIIEPETPVSHAPVQPGREEPGTTDGAASAGETAKNIEPEAAMLPQTDMASAPKDPSPEPEAVESSATSSRTGAAAKALGGSGQSTSSAGMEGEADRQPHSADRTKPNPLCADPDDCGVEASWTHMCGSCLRRRDAQRSAAEAMH